MYISTTKLELKNIWKLWKFFKYNQQVVKQIKSSKGLLSVDTSGSSFTEFFTLTSWQSKDDMLAFMRNGAHVEAMKASSRIAKKITVHGYEADEVPTWERALNILNNKQ